MSPAKCAFCGIAASLKCSGCKNVFYCNKEHQKADWKKIHKTKCKCYEVHSFVCLFFSFHEKKYAMKNDIKQNDISKLSLMHLNSFLFFSYFIFQIGECASIGRYLRANRNIEAGETILREKPLVYGPKIISAPICLGCNRYVKPQDIPISVAPSSTRNRNQKPKVKFVRNFYKCSTCKWPVCNSQCEKSSAHLAECQLMAEKKFQCSIDYNADEENRKESAYCAILPLRCLLMKRTNVTG